MSDQNFKHERRRVRYLWKGNRLFGKFPRIFNQTKKIVNCLFDLSTVECQFNGNLNDTSPRVNFCDVTLCVRPAEDPGAQIYTPTVLHQFHSALRSFVFNLSLLELVTIGADQWRLQETNPHALRSNSWCLVQALSKQKNRASLTALGEGHTCTELQT